MFVRGPTARSGLWIVVTWTNTVVRAVFPMDMGSKWVGLLGFRQRMWWIVVLVAPTGLGITIFGRAIVRSAVGRVLICPDMLDEHVGSMDRSERALGGGVLSCLVVPQR